MAIVGLLLLACSAGADEPPPLPSPLLESFTRTIQPLLLNRCATGGCHAGKAGREPLFQRSNAAGQIDRSLTLSNIEAFRRGADTPERARQLVGQLAVSHPDRRNTAPLTTAQMNVLRGWLVAACEADALPRSATAAPPPGPNRFREMLDAALNPAPLWPPPQEPKGLLLKDDPQGDE